MAYKEVEWLYQRDVEETYNITVGGEVITTTDEHPFWIVGKGWVEAQHLAVSDVLTTSDGKELAIEKIEVMKEHTTVYNFMVKDFHTYFVSNLGVWTHNACPRKPVTNVLKQVDHADGSVTYTKKTMTGQTVDVKYNSAGYADFSPHSIKNVRIQYSDNRSTDFANANKAAGYSSTPQGYTWHHCKSMQLVPTHIHQAFPHTGGFSMYP